MYIDLLEIQRSSFLNFLTIGICHIFENVNPLFVSNQKYIFFPKNYLVKIPSKSEFHLPINHGQISSFFNPNNRTQNFSSSKSFQGISKENKENSIFHYELSFMPCYSYNSSPVYESKTPLLFSSLPIGNKTRSLKLLVSPSANLSTHSKKLSLSSISFSRKSETFFPAQKTKHFSPRFTNLVSSKNTYVLLKKKYLQKSFPNGSRTKWNIFFHRTFLDYLYDNVDRETNYKKLYKNFFQYTSISPFVFNLFSTKKSKKKFPSLTLFDNQILQNISFQTKRNAWSLKKKIN